MQCEVDFEGKMREFLVFRAIEQFPSSRFDPMVWEEQMRSVGLHVDNPWLFNFVLEGVTHGFPIFVRDGAKLDLNKKNLPTSKVDDFKITEWLIDSLRHHRALGPFRPDQLPKHLFPDGVHINPLGCVPKPGGKIRPITHCSAPRSGNSVNSQTISEWKTVKYTSFIEVCRLVRAVGANGYLWCADAADAYLQLSLRPSDCKYVGVKWLGLILVFCVLIFGLSSAPKIYTHFADVIESIVCKKGGDLFLPAGETIQLIRHYLDDFFGGAKTKENATKQFELFLQTLHLLNVPCRVDKCTPPSRVMQILGFEYDTSSMVVRIPANKYTPMRERLLTMKSKRSFTKRELLQIIGKLRWFSTAIFGACAFVRRIEERAHSVKRLEHHVKVTADLRKDVDFWLTGFDSLNSGISVDFLLKRADERDVVVYSDASSTVGMGAFDSMGKCFQVRWSSVHSLSVPVDIYFAEMLACVCFLLARAEDYAGKSITIFVDNVAVEWSLRKKSCCFHRKDVAHLLRLLCQCAITHKFYFWVERVSTADNVIADALSRFDDSKLQSALGSQGVELFTIPLSSVKPFIERCCV